MKTSAVITSTSQAGTKIQKTLTDVNAECTNEVIKTAGQMLNNLTTNTYERTDRIDKQNCDTETTTAKTEPTLTVGTTSLTGFSYTYNGDGDVYVYAEGGTGYSIDRTQKTVTITGANSGQGYTGTLYATEGENYAAKSVTFSGGTGGSGGVADDPGTN